MPGEYNIQITEQPFTKGFPTPLEIKVQDESGKLIRNLNLSNAEETVFTVGMHKFVKNGWRDRRYIGGLVTIAGEVFALGNEAFQLITSHTLDFKLLAAIGLPISYQVIKTLRTNRAIANSIWPHLEERYPQLTQSFRDSLK
jgi:hypothetical protein